MISISLWPCFSSNFPQPYIFYKHSFYGCLRTKSGTGSTFSSLDPLITVGVACRECWGTSGSWLNGWSLTVGCCVNSECWLSYGCWIPCCESWVTPSLSTTFLLFVGALSPSGSCPLNILMHCAVCCWGSCCTPHFSMHSVKVWKRFALPLQPPKTKQSQAPMEGL